MPRTGSPAGELVLTLDIGGSGVKVSAYDLAAHRSVARLTGPYDDAAWNRARTEYDLMSWWGTVVRTTASVVERLDQPRSAYVAITVGAVRIPFVLLDSDSDIVRPAIANWDRRALAEATDIEVRFDTLALYRRTGHWAAPEFGLSKLLWLQRHEPEALRRARHLLQLHDWIIFMLSGVMASEPSSAAMSLLVRADGTGWDLELLAETGIPAGLLPELRPAGTCVGVVRPGITALSGLVGTPVYLGGGDTQLSVLGAGGLAGPGRVVVVAGSTVPVQVAERGAVEPREVSFPLLTSRQLVPGWGAYEANASSVGSTLQDLEGLSNLQGEPLMDALHDRGFEVSSRADDDLIVPIGNPVFGPEGWAAAPVREIFGLSRQTSGSDIYRAAVECGCFAIKSTVACLRDRARAISGPLVATGGLTADPVWCQTLADVMGEPVTVADHGRTAGIGGASVVTGASLWSDDDDESSTVYEPTDGAADHLRPAMARYLGLYSSAAGSVSDQVGSGARAR